MGLMSPSHLLIVIGVGILFFGRGAVKGWAKDIGAAIRSFNQATGDIKDVGDKATQELRGIENMATREIKSIRDSIR